MNITHIISKLIKKRILFILTGTISLCLILLLLFYSLFLLLPSLFIKAGLIAPLPLILILFLFIIFSLAIFTYKKPFSGTKFFNEIIIPPYSANDLKSAMELENGKSFPASEKTSKDKKDAELDPGENNISDFLSRKFIERILEHMRRTDNPFPDLIPDIKRVIACAIIVICSLLFSFIKSNLVFDVYSALRSGLPVELVSLDDPVIFEKIEAIITPPAYFDTGAATTTDLKVHNNIKVMQGSSVTIKGELKNIESGRLILSDGKGIEYFSAAIGGHNFFEVAFLAPMKGAFALEFEFAGSIAGKATGKSMVYSIEALPDQPPSIKIFSPPADHNVLFGNPVEINFSASDDYGILEILLYHRNPEQNAEYFKELVARFPKDPKTNYSGLYVWNPVIREGDKIDELVYDPDTKTIEYFLEVRDINTFSSGGKARSELRYLHFKDALSELKEGISLIQELIDDGKKLLKSPENRRMLSDYKNKLLKAVNVFSKDLLETMPESTLVQKTNEMLSALYIDNTQKMTESLKSYIAYLERYLVFINLLLESQSMDSIDKEFSKTDDTGGDMQSSLKRLSRHADILENEFRKDFEEIDQLLKKSDQASAQAKLDELLQKIKNRMSEELQKSMEMSQKISAEVKEKLDKMSKLASELLKKQEVTKAITDRGNIKGALPGQGIINEGLNELSAMTEKLSSEYPFIMYALNSYAGAAKVYGERAAETLKNSDSVKSSQNQSRVIQYLKNFMDSISQQKQLMEEIAKGNFESLMQRGFANRFVLIPKEAVYTIPIDYKNKIIEMSKDRSKLTKEKEDFWRDILE
jgi:hypothetical protein